MNHSLLTQAELFGLYELGVDGTVLFYKASGDNESATAIQNLVGLNFFTEVSHFVNIEEFRRRFENFVEGRQSVDSFTFNSSRSENEHLLRVMLVRLGGGGRDERQRFVLADFRQA